MKEDGLVVPVLSDAIDNVILTFLTTPGGRNWWDQTGYMFPNHDQVNELLSSHLPLRLLSGRAHSGRKAGSLAMKSLVNLEVSPN